MLTFQTTACTRCGGSGRSGKGECYGCDGDGFYLTADGKRARARYRAWCATVTVPAREIQPGMLLRPPREERYRRVMLVDRRGSGVEVTFAHGLTLTFGPYAALCREPTDDEVRANLPLFGKGAVLPEVPADA